MNKVDNKVYLVGILGDDGQVGHVKAFQNQTWAIKYGKQSGTAARFAELEIEWTTDAPEPRTVPVKVDGKNVAVEKEVQ